MDDMHLTFIIKARMAARKRRELCPNSCCLFLLIKAEGFLR